MIISLSTAAERRFVNDQGELNADYLREHREMASRALRLQGQLVAMAHQGELAELRFWIKELRRRRQYLTPAAYHNIIRKIRTMNKELPIRMQIPGITQVLADEYKRHSKAHGRKLLGSLSHCSRSWEFERERTNLRRFLRQANLKLDDIGSSEGEIRKLAAYVTAREAARRAERRRR